MKLLQLWQKIRTSFWFLPGLIVAGSVGLALLMIEADILVGDELFDAWPRVFGSSAAGARGLLATVASSMITVAGVVFSITIVALSLTSSQYTSRVLRNFMSDTVNQTVLGSFLGIFAYCLVVLRTIRGGESDAFMPSLAVLLGLVLAIVGIAVLIYFIHHIALSIQAHHILAVVARETLRAVDAIFPEGVGQESDAPRPEPPPPGKAWHPVKARRTGYMQNLDSQALLEFATRRDVVVRMEHGVGEFVVKDTPLASILAPSAPDEDDGELINDMFAIDRQRTVEQDAGYGIRQIVDVALKALSPGINDSTTAVMCVHYLTAILVPLTDRRIESHLRAKNGDLRLLTAGPSYASLLDEAFDQIRQNAAGNGAVLKSMLKSLQLLAGRTISPLRRRALLEHARALEELARRTILAPRDQVFIEEFAARTVSLLEGDGSAR